MQRHAAFRRPLSSQSAVQVFFALAEIGPVCHPVARASWLIVEAEQRLCHYSGIEEVLGVV